MTSKLLRIASFICDSHIPHIIPSIFSVVLIISSFSFQNAAKRREFLYLSCEEYHGVIFLQYRNLSELITQSRSERNIFSRCRRSFRCGYTGRMIISILRISCTRRRS